MNRSWKIVVALLITLTTSISNLGAGSDFNLGIYGNANMDDTIDEKDVAYVEGVIKGTNAATNLSDANYDGKIDEKDATQIEEIINGTEKEITIIDMAERAVTVPRPIERIVCISTLDEVRTMLQLGMADKLVGVSDWIAKSNPLKLVCLQAYPELKSLPITGSDDSPNMEQIIDLNPDVVFCSAQFPSTADLVQEKTGFPVVCITHSPSYAPAHIRNESLHVPFEQQFEAYRVAGIVVGKEKEAEDLVAYINEDLNKVNDVISKIPESEKPKVLFTRSNNTVVTLYDPIDIAGGINVASELMPLTGSTSNIEISKEQIILWNPDFILIHGFGKNLTYTVENYLNDPTLQTINAVKSHYVYYTRGWYVGLDPATALVECFYMAKLFHPDKFEDLDVEAKGNAILERFYGVKGLYTWMLENSDLHRWES
jgi:iron complex transport system substrate-binding protein